MSDYNLVTAIASNGAWGLAFALLASYALKLHVELRAEQAGRIEDIKEYARLASELQQRAHDSAKLVAQAVDKLALVIEFMGRHHEP